MNIIDRILVLIDNTYEQYTHWKWNRKPHSISCRICDATISSDKNHETYSPQECGWHHVKKPNAWICHRCFSHRNYRPYVLLADLDDKMYCDNKGVIKLAKRQILKSMLENI